MFVFFMEQKVWVLSNKYSLKDEKKLDHSNCQHNFIF